MSKLNVGYVGCGFMAQNVHLPNLSHSPHCNLQGLAEVRTDLGRKVQKKFGIAKFHASHQEMVQDASYDAFAVSAGFTTQGQIARDLLRSGRPVFMEKPMALSVRQAEEIVEAAQTPGARLMVGYMKRYDAGNQLVRSKVQEFLESGELGPITYVRAHGFCGDWIAGMDITMEESAEPLPTEEREVPAWLPADKKAAYVSYLQQYVHNLNLIRYLLDAGDDAHVTAVDLNDDGFYGIACLQVKGVRAVLESGGLRHHRWEEHTQIYFRDGWIQTWAPPLLHENLPAEVEIYYGGESHRYERPLPADRWSWAYRREIEAYLQAVQTGEEFLATGEDALTDVRLVEEIFRHKWG